MLQETSTAGQGMQLFSDTLQIYSQPLQVPFPVINIKISNQYIEESSWYLKKKKSTCLLNWKSIRCRFVRPLISFFLIGKLHKYPMGLEPRDLTSLIVPIQFSSLRGSFKT